MGSNNDLCSGTPEKRTSYVRFSLRRQTGSARLDLKYERYSTSDQSRIDRIRLCLLLAKILQVLIGFREPVNHHEELDPLIQTRRLFAPSRWQPSTAGRCCAVRL